MHFKGYILKSRPKKVARIRLRTPIQLVVISIVYFQHFLASKSDITQRAGYGHCRTSILHLVHFMLFQVLFDIGSLIGGVWTFVTEEFSFRVRCFCMRTDVFKCFESQCFAQHTFPFFLDIRFGA